MKLTVEQITAAALSLSCDERTLLADRLVESLDPREDAELHALWATEAQRRLEEVRSGKVKAIPGDVVFAQLRELLKK